MNIEIPEEIREALDTIRNESEEQVVRQMAGIKIGFWVLQEGTKNTKALEEEKSRCQASDDATEEDKMGRTIESLGRVMKIAARQIEIDTIFEEVKGIMESFDTGAQEAGDGQVYCNGKPVSIARIRKDNKNDGDKGIVSAERA